MLQDAMDALKWPLFLAWLCFTVVHTKVSPWTINLPSSVKGVPGSCVVIPCSFKHPDPGDTNFTGIWLEGKSNVIYHPVASKILQPYRRRTELLGDVAHNNCTLKIDPLQPSDQGPFFFRIEMANFKNFSYRKNTVSIAVISKPNVAVSVKDEGVEGQSALASCSASPSCPHSPPVFSWSRAGREEFRAQEFEDGQWKATATLTFRPTTADHNKPLICTARYSGGQQEQASTLLKVIHAPVNVKVDYKADVSEGDAVELKCTSNAHPPASSYRWYNESGAELHQGKLYVMPNVSRHAGAFYCTAFNAVGRGKSSPVRLNVLYAPEIKAASSCTSGGDTVKCVCIAESKPPCRLHFVLSERVLPAAKIERHGSLTIGTLQAEDGSSEFVQCLANNTVGDANVVLSLPVNGKMPHLYLAIAIGSIAVVLLILLISVGAIKKCRGTRDAPAPHIGATMANQQLTGCAPAKRKEIHYLDVPHAGNPATDHVYGNIETDWDVSIYANM